MSPFPSLLRCEALGPAWAACVCSQARCVRRASCLVSPAVRHGKLPPISTTPELRARAVTASRQGVTRDGGGAERRGQPAHVRRRRQQDRRAVGMDRSPEPDTGALVAAEARNRTPTTSRRSKSRGPCTRRSRGATNARIDDHFDSLGIQESRSFRAKRARACFSSTRSASRDCSISICSRGRA